MKDKTNLWRLYNSAAAYGKRPSDFMNLESDLAAWALDEACLMIGRKFENLLSNGINPLGQSEINNKRGYANAPKRLIKKKNFEELGIV